MKFLKLFLFVSFILWFTVSCTLNENSKDNNIVQGMPTQVTSPIKTAIPTNDFFVNIDNLFEGTENYEMLYVNNDNLLSITNGRPNSIIIQENVHPESFTPSPDYSRIVYGIRETQDDILITKLGLYNLVDKSNLLIDLPENNTYMPPFVLGWSESNEWVTLSFSPSNEVVLVLNTLTGTYRLLDWYNQNERPRTLTTYWLSNNTILIHSVASVINQSTGLDTGVLSTNTYVFDPINNSKVVIELDTNTTRRLGFTGTPTYLKTLDQELQSQGLSLATPQTSLQDNIAYYPNLTGAAVIETPEQNTDLQIPACDSWSVIHRPVRESFLPQELFNVQDAAILSDIRLLPDESLVVAQWNSPTCDEFTSDLLTIDLVYIESNQATTHVIASNIAYSSIRNIYSLVYDPFYSQRTNLYAISSDGQYIAWLETDTTETYS